jgi:hypothetical protein
VAEAVQYLYAGTKRTSQAAAQGQRARAVEGRVGGEPRGGPEVVRVGQSGESRVRAAAEIGPKVPIKVAGRMRIPDGLTSTVLSEVKNVASMSNTRQLRDYAAYRDEKGL